MPDYPLNWKNQMGSSGKRHGRQSDDSFTPTFNTQFTPSHSIGPTISARYFTADCNFHHGPKPSANVAQLTKFAIAGTSSTFRLRKKQGSDWTFKRCCSGTA